MFDAKAGCTTPPSQRDIVQALATQNPLLAWMYATGMLFTRQYRITGTFESGDASTQIHTRLAEVLYTNSWICALDYTLRRPNAFDGSIFQSLDAEMRKRNPFVDVHLELTGPDRSVLTEGFVPLETLPRIAQGAYWTVAENGNLAIDMVLTRQPASDEFPYEIDIVITVQQPAGGFCGQTSYQDAICYLEKCGYEVKYCPPC